MSRLASMEYKRRLDALTAKNLDPGSSSFEDLCRKSEGAFPREVYCSLVRLGAQERIAFTTNPAADDPLPELPEPHLLDADWRFTSETANDVAKLALQMGDRLAFLGTPTVFASAKGHGRDLLLIDRNPFTRMLAEVENNVLIWDLSCTLVDHDLGFFDVVVMDPPWYLETYLQWLDRAAELLVPGGVVLLTMLPSLARPSARIDQEKILELVLRNTESVDISARVEYSTPPFERVVLKQLGLPSMNSWRTAAILGFRLKAQLRFGSNGSSVGQPPSSWWRYRFGRRVVCLRRNETDWRQVHLWPISKSSGFVLDSVSARDPRRSLIDLWTSRNRCAIVAGKTTLGEALRGLEVDELSGHKAMLALADEDPSMVRVLREEILEAEDEL